jgi:hypothetical protein
MGITVFIFPKKKELGMEKPGTTTFSNKIFSVTYYFVWSDA